MIQRVYEQASKALDNVIVATDDERIYQCVKSFWGHVVMTSSHHACGTDRVQEAYTIARQTADWVDDQTVVVNIQGDEPFIQPSQITALMDCFADANTEIATLVHPFTPQNTWDDLALHCVDGKVDARKRISTSEVIVRDKSIEQKMMERYAIANQYYQNYLEEIYYK